MRQAFNFSPCPRSREIPRPLACSCDLVLCPFADPQKIMVEKLPCNIRLGLLQPGDIPFIALERVSPCNELLKYSFIIGILSEEYRGQRVQPRLLVRV